MVDLGCKGGEEVDFPDIAADAIHHVILSGTKNPAKRSVAILICGTGIGVSIAANRYSGIRAALCHSVEYAKLAREHNDANVLCLGGRFISAEEAKLVVDTFLNTDSLPEEKYARRNQMLDKKLQTKC